MAADRVDSTIRVESRMADASNAAVNLSLLSFSCADRQIKPNQTQRHTNFFKDD